MAGIRSKCEAQTTLGAWVALGNSISVEVVGKAGYDWVILDTQHGGITWDNLAGALQALELGETGGFVRVGWTDARLIMRALDLGAAGVIVPMVSTAEQAKIAAQAVRYPPAGNRSYGPVRNYYAGGGRDAEDPLCFVMIETAEGLQNVDAIAATPGVDGLFVGSMDLALALGLGLSTTMEEPVFKAIDEVVAACERHGKIPGCGTLGLPNAKELMGRGVRFLAAGSDVGHLRRGAAADVATFRQWVEKPEA
ncbi:HpcH/HpaI aldolase family protein [Novosphingobium pentaromativorans]|uniref:HpcH/HpaI aldolase/citrate lyase domain-containing protein n=1 Tax=Novosphingobium pentaromativorans US6-1 TaxID=1088721 RepID=G6ED92_9SPHN|nr:aldolase/citrate lyase family protein [Novosphingobium pentaromativorans]EHJ60691.1 hypothetical protein NSU_2313 [Novosphingobium pentaromativorans US6-1]